MAEGTSENGKEAWSQSEEDDGEITDTMDSLLGIDAKALNLEEVKSRLASYQDEDITSELLEFGKLMLSRAERRTAQIDSKAISTAGYCGALVAIIVSTATFWAKSSDVFLSSLPAVAAIVAGIAGFLAMHSTRLEEFGWFSADDWMNRDCLQDPRRLRRFHILAAWQILSTYRSSYATKTVKLEWAQKLLSWSLAILLATLLEYVIRQTVF